MPSLADLTPKQSGGGLGREPSLAEVIRRIEELDKVLRGEDGKGLKIAHINKAQLLEYVRVHLELEADQFAPGQVPNTALVSGASYMRDVGEHVFVYNTAAQNIANATTAFINFNGELQDVSATGRAQHDTVVNSSRITPQRSGIYGAAGWISGMVGGGFGWAVDIRANNAGALVANANFGLADGVIVMPPRPWGQGAAGRPPAISGLDLFGYFGLAVTNTTGAARNVFAQFSMFRLGDIFNNTSIDA